jgi:hypothetical protein
VFSTSVWLRAIDPILGGYAPHDDLHFIQFASSFCRGESLGTYGQLTHAKGIFYPLFVLIKKTSGRLVSWLVLVVAFPMLNRLIHWTAVFVPLALMPLMILSLGFAWIL